MHYFFSLCFLLPQIAGKVAAPLARTNEIIIMSGDNSRVTGEVTRLLAELPVSVNALTGVDMMKVRPPPPPPPPYDGSISRLFY